MMKKILWMKKNEIQTKKVVQHLKSNKRKRFQFLRNH